MVRFSSSTFVSLLALATSSYAIHPVSDILAGQPQLSTLVGLVRQYYPDLLSTVESTGGTVLAPSNAAIATFVGSLGPQGIQGVSNDTIRALLNYHFLPGERLNQTALSVRGGAVAETGLTGPESVANLGGNPQSVFASAYGSTGFEGSDAGALRIYSGAGDPAQVGTGNIGFDNGVVHIIDHVLNLPQNASATAQAAGLTTLVDALTRAELVEAVDTTPSVTIFAPSNDAFAALGVDLSSMDTTQLGDILKYHVIAGTVGYSPALDEEQEVETLQGQSVRITKRDGKIMVNEAEVSPTGNVILSNGVVHVINGVLIPPNATDGASPSGSNSAGGATGTGTTRRPGDPTGTSAGAEQSDEPAEGGAKNVKAGLFGLLGVVAAALVAL